MNTTYQKFVVKTVFERKHKFKHIYHKGEKSKMESKLSCKETEEQF